jgi:hypothetical protein
MSITAERIDRFRPPFIRQADLNWCWAASLEAWTRVDGHWGGVKTQQQWVCDPSLQAHLNSVTKAINIRTGMPYLRSRYHLMGEA